MMWWRPKTNGPQKLRKLSGEKWRSGYPLLITLKTPTKLAAPHITGGINSPADTACTRSHPSGAKGQAVNRGCAYGR